MTHELLPDAVRDVAVEPWNACLDGVPHLHSHVSVCNPVPCCFRWGHDDLGVLGVRLVRVIGINALNVLVLAAAARGGDVGGGKCGHSTGEAQGRSQNGGGDEGTLNELTHLVGTFQQRRDLAGQLTCCCPAGLVTNIPGCGRLPVYSNGFVVRWQEVWSFRRTSIIPSRPARIVTAGLHCYGHELPRGLHVDAATGWPADLAFSTGDRRKIHRCPTFTPDNRYRSERDCYQHPGGRVPTHRTRRPPGSWPGGLLLCVGWGAARRTTKDHWST